jgi:hypothetical protein
MVKCLFVVNRNCLRKVKIYRGLKSGEGGDHAARLLCLSVGHDMCYVNISHSTTRKCPSTIMHIAHSPPGAVAHLPVALTDHVIGNLGSGCL